MEILNKLKNFILGKNNPKSNIQKSLRETKNAEELLEIKNNDFISNKALTNKNFTLFEFNNNVGYSNFVAGNFYVIKDSKLIFSKKMYLTLNFLRLIRVENLLAYLNISTKKKFKKQ